MEFNLQGNESFLTTAIPLMLNIQLMLKDQSIGYFVGQPLDEYVKATPLSTKLYIRLYSQQHPPFSAEPDKKFVRATYGIPDVDRSKLDWGRIKQAVGGVNGFMWGRFSCILWLDNRRKIQVYGESKRDCQKIARNLQELSTTKIVSERIFEQEATGFQAKEKKAYKKSTRIYPAYCYIMNQEKILAEDRGYPTRDGNFVRKRSELIPLWVPKEPRDFKEKIRNAFYIPGVSQ